MILPMTGLEAMEPVSLPLLEASPGAGRERSPDAAAMAVLQTSHGSGAFGWTFHLMRGDTTHLHAVSCHLLPSRILGAGILSPSIASFSTCLQSFPASGSFPISQLVPSGGQSIGASASASVLPVNIQG